MSRSKLRFCCVLAFLPLLHLGAVAQTIHSDSLKDLSMREVRNLFDQAVVAGDLEVCKTILDSGRYYINDANMGEYTQLYFAACSGQTDICRLLLEHGANPMIDNPGKASSFLTPLEAAIANDYTETALLLIDAAKPETLNPRKGRNKPALFLAIANENPEIVKALILKGADVNTPDIVRVNTPDIMMEIVQTPLYFATLTKNLEICRLLVDAGADVNFKQGKVQTFDALFISALTNQEEMCRFWIDSKVKLDVQDSKFGLTLLNYLLHFRPCNSPVSNIDVYRQVRSPFSVIGPFKKFEEFLPVSNDSNDERDPYDEEGWEEDTNENSDEISQGVQQTYDMCKILIDAGGDVNLRDKWNCSPVEALILTQMQEECFNRKEFQKLLQLLIDSKTDMNAKDKNGWTPLHYILFAIFQKEDQFVSKQVSSSQNAEEIANQKMEFFQMFLDVGADPTVIDNQGNTLLHYAISSPGESMSKGPFVCDLDYEINSNDPVFCRKLIALLIEKGVSPGAANKNGETPFDWSRGFSRSGKSAGSMSGGMGGMSSSGAVPMPIVPSPISHPSQQSTPKSNMEAVDMLMGEKGGR